MPRTKRCIYFNLVKYIILIKDDNNETWNYYIDKSLNKGFNNKIVLEEQ